jgi:hypothetical protein
MGSAPRHRVDTATLRAALEDVLSSGAGGRCRVRELRRRSSAYSSTHALENLEIELDRGAALRLVFKDLGPAGVLESAARVRPEFLCDPRREIETYRRILAPLGLGTPAFHGAVVRPGRQRYWLFLERVSGPLLWQTGEMEVWRDAARWLGWLQTAFDHTPRLPQEAARARLLRYDRSFYESWLNRAAVFVQRTAPKSPAGLLRRFDRLVERYAERVIQPLLALPSAFLHGEFYPSNVIVRRSGRAARICPIDWEMAALGAAPMDVAALVSGAWEEEPRRVMVASYRTALSPAKGWPPSLAALLEAVTCCQLHLAVQMLGWAADWAPPKEHARDWLREACRLAGKLGL